MNLFRFPSSVQWLRSFVSAGILLLIAAEPAPAQQVPPIYPQPYPETVYVKANATGLNNGQSWTDAFTTLDPAIAVAVQDAEIWVAQGTYRPVSATTGFLITKRLNLYGGFAGTEPTLADRAGHFQQTILSADINNTPTSPIDNGDHVVTIQQVAATLRHPGVVIDGFRIRDGFGSSTAPSNPAMDLDGGGIYSYCSDLYLVNCYIHANSAEFGGGLYFQGGCNNPPSQIAIPNNLRIKKCEFGSTSSVDKNGADVDGGAIFAEMANGEIVNTKFLENLAGRYGGAAFFWKMGSNNRIDLTNCAFWRNHSADSGGAVYLGGTNEFLAANARITNCTFTQNFTSSCVNGTALFVTASAIASVHNSILFYSFTPGFDLCGGTSPPIVGNPTVTFSDVQQFIGTGNIMANPQFINYLTGFDLRLNQGSPCLDRADYNMLPPDHLDVNEDGNTGQVMPIDLLGSTRMIDNPNAPDLGSPANAPWLDIGAYERP